MPRSAPTLTYNLPALVERVSRRDRTALRLIYAQLCPSATRTACRTLSRTEDVRAVVQGTFVEVWWMARFHTAADVDITAWVLGIAARRAGERARAREPEAGWAVENERHRLEIDALLGSSFTEPAAGRRVS